MLKEILIFIVMSCTPLVESRVAIPYGLSSAGLNLHPLIVLFVTLGLNIAMGAAIYESLHFLRKITKIHPPTYKFQENMIAKTHGKLRPYIEKYGPMGLAVFIAIPIPGSGTITGAVAAQLLKIKRKDFYIAMCLGIFAFTALIIGISLGFVTL